VISSSGRPDTRCLIAEGRHPLPVKAECDSSTQVEVAAFRLDTQSRNCRGQTPSPSKENETPGSGRCIGGPHPTQTVANSISHMDNEDIRLTGLRDASGNLLVPRGVGLL